MKNSLAIAIASALVATTPLTSVATTFFTDDFGHGSTLNFVSPVKPTSTNTSYEMVSSKSWSPTPSIASGNLKFGIASTTSGSVEVQALFATNALALVAAGDYVEMIVTFTNTGGILTNSSTMGFGMYNSGQVLPVAGGL